MDSVKELSVVIAAGSGRARVKRCLKSLEAAGARELCEVIVVSPRLVKGPEWVRYLAAPPRTPYASLRAAGLSAASAPLAAVLSEDYTVDAAWLEHALKAGGADVTAGLTLPPSKGGLAARAAWLWEYAHLASPMHAGPLRRGEAALAPAGNVIYRRDRIDPKAFEDARSEMEYHRRMFDSGLKFSRDPDLVAEYGPPHLRRFVRHRARWSEAWARARAKGMSRPGRWAAAASRLLLPPLLLARFAVRILRKPRYWLTSLAGLPLFVVFACAQAYGEARAYLEHG